MRQPGSLIALSAALLLCAISTLSAAQSAPSSATPAKFEYTTALRISQDAIGNQLGDYSVTEIDGKRLRLSELRGKPMVLSLIFTSCHQICPMTSRHLMQVVEKARAALGRDTFSVVTIGFDTAVDTPEAMRHFARQQGMESAGWRVFSIDAADVEGLTRDTGLIYFPSARGFDHIIQTTVIDASGRVYRQVYGQAFATPLLVEPLKDLVLGTPQPSQTLISDLFNKVRFFCTTYDPVRDDYYFDYSLFIGMFIGASIIIFASIWLIKETRYRQRLNKST